MKHILSDKKGEGHINTAVIIIIAVVIGGLLIAGLYALFAGNNGVFDQLGNEIDHMSNMGEEMQLKKENNALYYSYDGETWKNVKVTGMEEGATIKTYLTAGEGDTLVHLIVYKMSTGMERACYSLDGIDWIPFNSDKTSLSLTKRNSGTLDLYCDDGRTYYSKNGLDWVLTSTKRY